MIKNLFVLLRYALFWLVIFVLSRTVFIVVNYHESVGFSIGELIASYYYGLKLDLSAVGYLLVLPLLIWTISHFTKQKKALDRVVKIYTGLMLVLVVIITTADAELYRFWGQKLNTYASSFAQFPKQMFASGGAWSGVKIVLLLLLQFTAAWFLYRKLVAGLTSLANFKGKWIVLPVFALLGILCFLGIRGSFGKAAINQSSAYYSSQLFLNHAAVNASWNMLSSVVNRNDAEQGNVYAFMPEVEARTVVDSLYGKSTVASPVIVDASARPNIILIILEGWGADVIEPLGGEAGVTPQLNSLAREGLLFTKFYSSGNRTDKGMASIISAQPSLARSSIINKIEKFSNLPSICKSFTAAGYKSLFVYGGESIFANMRGYWLNAGYERIVDLPDFSPNEGRFEWGVHDYGLFKKLISEAGKMKQPFFASALTLSSHEPFEVPFAKFIGSDDPQLYRNAVSFADSCLGEFIKAARQQSWYNNTLIVVTADHGHQWPLDRKAYDPQRFHIPLLITGGALKEDWKGKTCNTTGSQTDIASTLLSQFGMNTTAFGWSKDLLNIGVKGFATFTYNDGIGWIDSRGAVVFDQETRNLIYAEGVNSHNDSIEMERAARAYEQAYYSEYLKR